MHTITLAGNPREFQKHWCVYKLRDVQTAAVKFMGLCRLANVFDLPDAKANALFAAYFPPGSNLILEVCDIVPDKVAAYRRHGERTRELGMTDMTKYGHFSRHAPIVCNQTGEVFRTMMECCKAHDISQSALSMHLSGKGSVNTIKGRTYSRQVKII